MDAPKPTLIPLTDGKSVPLRMLVDSLRNEIGVTTGSFAIVPQLAEAFAQFTENPNWRNLPTEPTWITRVNDNTWEVKVGDYTGFFKRDELIQRMRKTLDENPKDDPLTS